MVLVLDGGPATLMLSIVFYIAAVAGAFVYRYQSGAWRKIALIGHADDVLA